MSVYHKIQTVYKRDPETKFKTLLVGQYSMPEFEYLQNNLWVFTEKVDGTNVRVIWDGETVRFGGKTDNAQLHAGLINHLNESFPVDKLDAQFGDGEAVLYGEGYGAKIQSGGKYRGDQGFVLFDVMVGGWWLRREGVRTVAESLGIECVPTIGVGTLSDMVDVVRGGFTSKWGDFTAEGIVARPGVDLFTRRGDKVITKLKHKDFGGTL